MKTAIIFKYFGKEYITKRNTPEVALLQNVSQEERALYTDLMDITDFDKIPRAEAVTCGVHDTGHIYIRGKLQYKGKEYNFNTEKYGLVIYEGEAPMDTLTELTEPPKDEVIEVEEVEEGEEPVEMEEVLEEEVEAAVEEVIEETEAEAGEVIEEEAEEILEEEPEAEGPLKETVPDEEPEPSLDEFTPDDNETQQQAPEEDPISSDVSDMDEPRFEEVFVDDSIPITKLEKKDYPKPVHYIAPRRRKNMKNKYMPVGVLGNYGCVITKRGRYTPNSSNMKVSVPILDESHIPVIIEIATQSPQPVVEKNVPEPIAVKNEEPIIEEETVEELAEELEEEAELEEDAQVEEPQFRTPVVQGNIYSTEGLHKKETKQSEQQTSTRRPFNFKKRDRSGHVSFLKEKTQSLIEKDKRPAPKPEVASDDEILSGLPDWVHTIPKQSLRNVKAYTNDHVNKADVLEGGKDYCAKHNWQIIDDFAFIDQVHGALRFVYNIPLNEVCYLNYKQKQILVSK